MTHATPKLDRFYTSYVIEKLQNSHIFYMYGDVFEYDKAYEYDKA